MKLRAIEYQIYHYIVHAVNKHMELFKFGLNVKCFQKIINENVQPIASVLNR